MSADETVHWHGLQLADAVQLLDTNLPNGLSEAEAWLRILAAALAASIIVAFEKWLRARVEPHQATAVPWQPVAHRS